MTAGRPPILGIVIPFVLLLAAPVAGHVGSPDVFVDVNAGPYRTLVTIRPPSVIPGIAEVDVRVVSGVPRSVSIVPTPMTGAGAKFAPTPDRIGPSAGDPRWFSGSLWMMTAGAWQVRVAVDGDLGVGTVAVPVPTLPQATRAMSRPLSLLLMALMLLLSAGAVSIVAAIAREATRGEGVEVTAEARRRGRIAAAIAVCVIAVVLGLGNYWWSTLATSYARYVYKPIEGVTSIDRDNRLMLTLRDPGWIALRTLDDFVEDHGHPMHLFVVSSTLDRLWHLHPALGAGSTFEQQLPAMPAGRYEYFADVVHASGIPETVTGTFDVTGTAGLPLSGDDSAWTGSPSQGNVEAGLPDGGRVVWMRDAQAPVARALTMFTFRVDDASGRSAGDLELYMGMPAHAVFIRKDLRVFAHVHPSGSAPMASLDLANGGSTSMDMPMDHAAGAHGIPPVVTFPYGFPSSGDYRIFVQIKRQGRIETAAFDVAVSAAAP
jgi:hypothetical protein